ncbi:MAG: FKBP-type peptidyl-prolyl cis-trans isomerase [Bacteroidales bacterium]|nr:FKBP-type peptidyl-prolyl cis-trans isomerase [Bacteroidales bacterium]
MIFYRNRIIRACVPALCALVLCCFCTGEDEKNQLASQSKSIDDFIRRDTSAAYSKNKDTVIVVTNKRETNRIVWNPRMGDDTLAQGDTVVFAYVGRIFSSGRGQVFATNIPQLIDNETLSISIYPDDFGRNAVGVGRYIPGLDAGLKGMRSGEHASIVFTSQYGYGSKELSIIPRMSPLIFEVEVIDVIKKK